MKVGTDIFKNMSSRKDTELRDEETKTALTYANVGLSSLVSMKRPVGVTAGQDRMCHERRNEGHYRKKSKIDTESFMMNNQLLLSETGSKHTNQVGKLQTAIRGKVTAHGEDQRRKWKRKTSRNDDSKGISQASARMLFQCSCQLLQNQLMEYDVRAREMKERNAVQTKEIDDWVTRIRSLTRELEEYANGQCTESSDRALIEATHRIETKTVNVQQSKALPSTAVAFDAVEVSLPPDVIATELKLQKEAQAVTKDTGLLQLCAGLYSVPKETHFS